jgi:hypothetical protein
MSENQNLPVFMREGARDSGSGPTLFKTLRRFRQPRPEQERCEFCNAGLLAEHRHLLEISKNRIVCTCDPCALRFQDVADGRFKLIPRNVWRLAEFSLSDAEWESLALPISLAFFFYNATERKMKAMYPSPAGATESLLPLVAWNFLAEKNSGLSKMSSDVEALLVNRVGAKREHYIVPIDVCFELVGLIRIHWRGLSGGDAVWREIDTFFVRLNARARVLSAPSNA